MQSPADPSATLVPIELEPGLQAFRCPTTQGVYLLASSYWAWQRTLDHVFPRLPAGDETLDVPPPTTVRLCPETGTVMTRYKVGHGFSFSIDRSITGGIWLDGGEWEALKERGFHDELHRIFTAPWQASVQNAEREAALDKHFAERLGPDLKQEVQAIRDRAIEAGKLSDVIAFLTQGLRR
ncbi:MAG: zf-TFIIB domain-containing protein [Verrucomicrobiales bacterium]|nr:zf-TFIIB domain-containing protein [Verrucomicrobiales bacterium]